MGAAGRIPWRRWRYRWEPFFGARRGKRGGGRDGVHNPVVVLISTLFILFRTSTPGVMQGAMPPAGGR